MSDDTWDDDLEGPDSIDLDRDELDESDVSCCPSCGAEIYEDAERCPSCHQYVTVRGNHGPRRNLAVLVLIAVAAALLLILLSR
jgi:uncharacterized paraquat-inducible protein A